MRPLLTSFLAGCSAALIAGCTATAAGTVVPARDSAGIVGVGRSIPHVLPTNGELSAVLKSPVEDDGFPPSVGGPDVLSSWVPDGSDPACVGAVYPYSGKPYEGAPVRAVATRDWSGIHTRFWVKAGAVALASYRDAKTLFDRFVIQWRQCQGRAVILYHKPEEIGIPDYRNDITDVQVSDDMLTAVVLLSSSDRGSELSPDQRAVGLVYNCIIDVEVTDFHWRQTDPGGATQARDVVKLMRRKPAAPRNARSEVRLNPQF